MTVEITPPATKADMEAELMAKIKGRHKDMPTLSRETEKLVEDAPHERACTLRLAVPLYSRKEAELVLTDLADAIDRARIVLRQVADEDWMALGMARQILAVGGKRGAEIVRRRKYSQRANDQAKYEAEIERRRKEMPKRFRKE